MWSWRVSTCGPQSLLGRLKNATQGLSLHSQRLHPDLKQILLQYGSADFLLQDGAVVLVRYSEVHVSVMFTELSATALTHTRSPRLWQNMSQWSKVGTYQSQSSDHQQVSRMLLLFTYVTQTDSQNNKYVSIYCR